MTEALQEMTLADVAVHAGRIVDEIERAVIGKREALELALAAMLADGHVLIEDFPGLAKTLIARSFATVTGTRFSSGAVHARPDAIGHHRLIDLQPAHRGVRVPPRTGVHQRAACRRDQPRSAENTGCAARGDAGTAGDDRGPHPLARAAVVVLATQNPIEYEGTYPLPEAQLDRFLIRMRVGYPCRRRMEMLERRLERREDESKLTAVVDRDEFLAMQRAVETVYVSESVGRYMVALVGSTRTARASRSAQAHVEPSR